MVDGGGTSLICGVGRSPCGGIGKGRAGDVGAAGVGDGETRSLRWEVRIPEAGVGGS